MAKITSFSSSAANQLSPSLTTIIDGKESVSNKGAVNGYAPLDSTGKIPVSNIPIELISNTATPETIELMVPVVQATTGLSVGTRLAYIRLPFNMVINKISATVYQPSTSGSIIVDTKIGIASALNSNRIVIEQGEVSTFTSTNQPTLALTQVPLDTEITIDVNSAGIGAQGLTVHILGTKVASLTTIPVPVNTVLPSITGTNAIGQVLTAHNGTFTNSPTSISQIWYRNGTQIAVGSTYTLAPADAGNTITMSVIAANDGGSTLATSSPMVIVLPVPQNTAIPSLVGGTYVGSVMPVSNGTWLYSNGTYNYQWYKNSGAGFLPISGATFSTYTLQQSDIGSNIRVGLKSSNATGISSEYFSLPILVLDSIYGTAWPPAPYDPDTLRDMTIPLVGTNRTFNVGPGQTHTEMDTIPWLTLQPGDVINIFYRPTPYTQGAKLGVRNGGTAANPIIINGVWDVDGNMPIISGNGATTAIDARSPDGTTQPYFSALWTEKNGLIQLGNDWHSTKAAHIKIFGLWIKDCDSTFTFIDQFGATKNYDGGTSAIYCLQIDDLEVSDCWISDSAQGFFVNTQGNIWERTSSYIYVRRNCFFNNGYSGNVNIGYGLHNLYVQAGRTLYEGNYFGPLKNDSYGCQLKDRGSGTVFRNNWVDCCTNGQSMFFSGGDGGLGTVTTDPLYPNIWMYGNVFRSALISIPSLTWSNYLMYVGGGQESPENKYGPYYIYNNSVLIEGNEADRFFGKYFMHIDPGGVHVKFTSNVVFTPGDTPLILVGNSTSLSPASSLDLEGTNWLSTPYLGTPSPTPAGVSVVTTGTVLTGTDPSITSSFIPIQGSPLIGAGATVLSNMPAPAVDANLQVDRSPKDMSQFYKLLTAPSPIYKAGTIRRSILGSATDIGAYEVDTGVPTPPPPVTVDLEPGVDNIFYWEVPDTTTPHQVNSKWNIPAAPYKVYGGMLQCTNFWGASKLFYSNGQGDTQYSSFIRAGAAFSDGLVCVDLQTTTTTGYSIQFSQSNITLFKNGGWTTGFGMPAGWSLASWNSDVTLSAKIVAGVISVYVNGTLCGTYTDATPITGGFPGLSFYPNGTNVAMHQIKQWTDNAF